MFTNVKKSILLSTTINQKKTDKMLGEKAKKSLTITIKPM
jgi:hypothetical protein